MKNLRSVVFFIMVVSQHYSSDRKIYHDTYVLEASLIHVYQLQSRAKIIFHNFMDMINKLCSRLKLSGA